MSTSSGCRPAPSVPAAAARIERPSGVSYAVPDYIAHIAGNWYPDDPGRSSKIRRLGADCSGTSWRQDGVNAPAGVGEPARGHRPGAKGVVIAVVDTGVAFRNWRSFKRSPDFRGTRFIDPCDLVAGTIRNGRCTDPYALDRESHGTFVAGMIAEATNNNFGLTGLAYQATIMPVRVLDAPGQRRLLARSPPASATPSPTGRR